MRRGWQSLEKSSVSVNHWETPSSFHHCLFSMWKTECHRCNRMENEAVTLPSKRFLCLAQVFSSFTPTSGKAQNKRLRNKSTRDRVSLIPPSYSTFLFLFTPVQSYQQGLICLITLSRSKLSSRAFNTRTNEQVNCCQNIHLNWTKCVDECLYMEVMSWFLHSSAIEN